MTRREFSIDFFNFVFMAFFFASIFVAPFVCAWHYMDRAMSVGNTAPHRPRTFPLAVLGEPGASVPKASNREAGADPQADRATPCRASSSPVSIRPERSGVSVSSPRSGAVLWDSSHVVGRVLEPRILGEVAPGSARSSSGIRGEAPMVSAQGEVFEGGAVWKADTRARTWKTISPASYPANDRFFQKLVGVAPDRHLRTLARSAANLCGVPVDLFAALIARESSWNPEALSSSGAVGLAQVKPSTARGVSATLDVYRPFDNLLLGACYLRQQFDRFGSWPKALHAYHAGPTAVDENAVPAASVRYAAQIGAAR